MRNARILVVEDEIIVARDIQQTLTRLGYEVPVVATSGESAIRQAAATAPNLILMDIRLRGDMDGIAAAGQIRRQFDLPVVYLTAHSDTNTIDRARGVEPYGYLVKPFTEQDLYAAIEIALHRHEADGTHRQMEHWLAATLRSVGDAVIATDMRERITFMNRMAEALTGWTQADASGRPLDEVFIVVADADRTPIANPVTRALQKGLVVEIDPRALLIARDGRVISISDSAAPIRDEHGNITGAVLVFRDVSDRRRAEAALHESELRARLIADLVSDYAYILRVEEDGRLILEWGTEAFTRGLGYTTEAFAARGGWLNIAHPADLALAEQHLQRLLAGERDVCEFRVVSAHGEVRWLRIYAQPEWDAERARVARISGAAQDITDRKQLEAQLLHSQKMESIGRLAGGIAHDFNNLLTAITGNTELVLDVLAPDDPLRNDLHTIQHAADRAAGLTRQLLAFARKQILEAQVFSLNDLILNMDQLLRRLIGEDIKLVTLTSPALGSVKADPGQIEQVLVNLAVNARDAMPAGGKLTIETSNIILDDAYARRHVSVTPGAYVMLAVSDTGIGMSPEVQARLFEPFFTTKGPGQGTGLGLATCYGIVKQHGGNIWVYSEVGQGTTFKIYLPRAEEAAAEPTRPAETAPPDRGVETVLLVEDEPTVRELAARVLRQLGYTVLEATNGEEALDVATTYAGVIQLLLADMVMPQMGGQVLAARLAETCPGIKVLFMSGYTDNAIVHHGQLDEGVVFLQKPFTPATLAHKVREALDA